MTQKEITVLMVEPGKHPILRDIGMYLGETFIKNNSNIHWGYYTEPRRDFFVNHPLLQGFVDRSFGKSYEVCFVVIVTTRPFLLSLQNFHHLLPKS